MDMIKFKAELPENDYLRSELKKLHKRFSELRDLINSNSNFAIDKNSSEFEKNTNYDPYVVSDIIKVLNDTSMNDIYLQYKKNGYWSFTREKPYYGAALVSLSINEPQEEMYIRFRIKGSFTDIEMTSWCDCKIINPEYNDFSKFENLLFNSKIHFFWKIVKNSIVGSIIIVNE